MTDANVVDRIQFAFTIMFHYIFPITTMGLAPVLVFLRTMQLRTGLAKYEAAFRFWVRFFAIAFVTGVISGVPMEFQFGADWAVFSAFAGGIIAQTLAMEGVFAFFLESSFLGIVLFGQKRVTPFFHWLATILLAVGSWVSGFFITATNAWMQHPVGYAGRAERLSAPDQFVGAADQRVRLVAVFPRHQRSGSSGSSPS